MKISPLDIQQQQFKGKFFGGLDPQDVDAFLQMLAEEMETLIRENNDLKEQSRKIAADMSEMGRRETDLRETMLAAQRVTEEMKANARKEATLLISEAELNGERILSNSEKKLVELNNQLQELRRQKVQFETAFKSLLDTHFKMLSMHDE